MSDWLKKACNVNIMKLIFIKDNYLGRVLWWICLFMAFVIQMGLDVINHQGVQKGRSRKGVWKGKSRICIIPSMVAFNPLMRGDRISWGLGSNSGARAKGDIEFILFWEGFMSWTLVFHTDDFHCILTHPMAFYSPKNVKQKCSVWVKTKSISNQNRRQICSSLKIFIIIQHFVLLPLIFRCSSKCWYIKYFCTLQFSYTRALCIFMLNFETTKENRIACASSLLPPPSTFTLNWAQFHKKLCLGSWDMLNYSKMNSTFWLRNEIWRLRNFLLVSAFTGTVPCSLSPLRSARLLMKRRWNC